MEYRFRNLTEHALTLTMHEHEDLAIVVVSDGTHRPDSLELLEASELLNLEAAFLRAARDPEQRARAGRIDAVAVWLRALAG